MRRSKGARAETVYFFIRKKGKGWAKAGSLHALIKVAGVQVSKEIKKNKERRRNERTERTRGEKNRVRESVERVT